MKMPILALLWMHSPKLGLNHLSKSLKQDDLRKELLNTYGPSFMKRGEGGKEDKHNSLKKTGETSEQNKIIE